MKNKSDTWGNV